MSTVNQRLDCVSRDTHVRYGEKEKIRLTDRASEKNRLASYLLGQKDKGLVRPYSRGRVCRKLNTTNYSNQWNEKWRHKRTGLKERRPLNSRPRLPLPRPFLSSLYECRRTHHDGNGKGRVGDQPGTNCRRRCGGGRVGDSGGRPCLLSNREERRVRSRHTT